VAPGTSAGLQSIEAETSPQPRADPAALTRAELYRLARELEIPRRSRMTKAQLAAAIEEARGSGGSSAAEALLALGKKATEPVAPAAAKSVEVAKSLVREAQAFVTGARELGATAVERIRGSE